MMTNKEIAKYARRFFTGCGITDDCGDCVFDNTCQYTGFDTEREFEEFLDKYNRQTGAAESEKGVYIKSKELCNSCKYSNCPALAACNSCPMGHPTGGTCYCLTVNNSEPCYRYEPRADE